MFQNLKRIEDEKTKEVLDSRRFLSIDILADTHGKHRKIDLQGSMKGEILIFAGDFLNKTGERGFSEKKIELMADFNDWLGKLPHKVKIVTTGNHDEIDYMFPEVIQKKYLTNAVYLQNKSYELNTLLHFPDKILSSEENQKITIFGSPCTVYRRENWKPFSCNNLKLIWDLIPLSTDILVTHVPPRCVMDVAYCKPWNESRDVCEECGEKHHMGRHIGCVYLNQRIEYLLQNGRLKVHVFGHCHDDRGTMVASEGNPTREIRFVNANSSRILSPISLLYEL